VRVCARIANTTPSGRWGAFTAMAVWAVPDVETYESQEPLRKRLGGFVRRFDSVGAILTLFGTGMFTAAIT